MLLFLQMRCNLPNPCLRDHLEFNLKHHDVMTLGEMQTRRGQLFHLQRKGSSQGFYLLSISTLSSDIFLVLSISIQHGPKNKTSGPFRIPGLGGNALVQKTGINTSSATRVITFLPTPLPVNDSQRETEENVIDIFQPLSSPPSSPISFDPDDETEELKIRLSSPPTSDPVQDDGNMKLPIDLEEIKRRYLHVPQKAKEVGLVFI